MAFHYDGPDWSRHSKKLKKSDNMELDLKTLNENLSSLSTLRRKNKPVHKKEVNRVDRYNGSQGESDEIYEVYDIGLSNGVFVKIQIGSDSYGENETIEGIQFVKAVEKTIKVYEYEE